ncbi:MAG: bifunctional precorrin-2 dehydrogenase/sirohydrochlorin ferrochelatase [Acidimicrobiia bacterium]|nr:bifunctional precorrin-2 dehydrogenase/sirohydrochlorin ferrochelatase [Acidimicrobiia bacterium]
MTSYPVNLVIAGRSCLVVGGGPVAAGKVAGLLECDARVDVVAPEIVEAIASDPRVTCHRRPYVAADLDGRVLVISATGDPAVDGAVFRDAEARGIWVNSADDPEHCTVTLPARVRQGSILVTVSTEGRSPAVASWLRRQLQDQLGPEYETLLDVVAAEREAIRAEGRSTEGLDWQRALDSGMLDLIRQGRTDEAKELLRRCLSSSSA